MSELWELVWGKPQVDPVALASAIESELKVSEPDFRTRVLIRDGTDALERHWGSERLLNWLAGCPERSKIEAIRCEDLGEPGFPLLQEQLTEMTQPDVVNQFFRELGSTVSQPAKLNVGGAIALILNGYISRSTSDIDVADEVPEILRNQRDVLSGMEKRYGLLLTHFQSHYLPGGWESRVRHYGTFGKIDVFTIDGHDLFVGKLFSQRVKDRDDLRLMLPKLDVETLLERLRKDAAGLLSAPGLRGAAEQNWYILFGTALPV